MTEMEVTSRRGFEGQKEQSSQNRVDVKVYNKPSILHASFLKTDFLKVKRKIKVDIVAFSGFQILF